MAVRSAMFVGPMALTAEPWEESHADGTRESGCRVQLRRVRDLPAPVPPPVPRRDAVFWSIEAPIWRADLFSMVGGSVPFDAAHYHPTFTDLVPCERVGDPALQVDAMAWIEGRLADVPALLAEAGYPELGETLDPDELRDARTATLAAIRAILDDPRAT